jgi:anaerobic selenocysteine-containing dehydrogenase
VPDTMPLDIVHSACPHDCPSCCALEVERIDAHTIGRVRGAKENTYTCGVICAKVARYAERVHHPGRLKTPLRRVGDKGVGVEAFEPMGWDEALDEVAGRFKDIADEYGSEAVWPFFYAGTMGYVQRDGIERLRHVMKYSRQHSTICSSLSNSGWLAGVGLNRGSDSREMANSDLIISWGTNPVATQVNVMHHVTEARRNRGAKLAVVDPYRTATAEKADYHLMLRPGTDGALACAIMHVLFAEGLADRDYMAKFTDAPDELEAHLQSRGPDWAAGITGLSADEIRDFARVIGRTPRTFFRLGYGFSRSRNGAANLFAVSCIPAVSGAWRHKGGGALYSNSQLYRLDLSLIMGLDAVDKSTRLLDQSRIGPILTGSADDLGDGPPVKALLIQNTNPVMVMPDTTAVREGFSRDDLFVCVHEQFMTETAAMADIVLPATTFLEHEDFYIGNGHTHIQVVKPVIEPVGESRSNHEVICALAKRLGARHGGFDMSAWELIDATLKASGYPDAETVHAAHWLDCAKPFEEMNFLNGFPTADGKFRFKPNWSSIGNDYERMPKMPDHFDIIDNATEERPFRLIAAPAHNYLNSSFTETPTSQKKEKRPAVMMHPEDCAEVGLKEGDRARIGNAQGSVVVHTRSFDGLQRGVVVVESIWPNAAFEEGRGINTLISAEPGPPRGGAVIHDTAVWIRPA